MTSPSSARRATAVYLVLAGLQRGVSLLILPFISHAMSPPEYGGASVLTATAPLLVTLIAAPLESLVFRTAARGGDDSPALSRVAGLYCYAVVPAISAIAAAGAALFSHELLGVTGAIWGIELLAVGLLPATTYYALPSVRARHDLRKFIWLALTSALVTATAKVLLVVVWKMGLLGWAISDLISAVVSFILAVVLVRLPRAHVLRRHIREVANFSVPLIPHRASFWALSALSRPVMALVSSLTQVGLLSFGINLASVAGLILTEINQAVLPHYSRETFPAPTNETRSIVKWQLVLAFAVPALVGAGLAITGPWLLAESYWPSLQLTGILLCGQAAVGIYQIPINYVVQAAGLPRFSAIASVSGALFILIGILVVGRQFGATGAAYATVGGFVAMAVVAFVVAHAMGLSIRWAFWNTFWPEMLGGMAAMGCSIVALSYPAGSAPGRGLAAASLILVSAALLLTSRRKLVQ